MRQMLTWSLLAFVITLAIVVGYRLSSEALAVVVGIVLGVLAGIPTSLLIVFLLRRQPEQRSPSSSPQHPPAAYPPVIVINPGGSSSRQPLNPFLDAADDPSAGHRPREFRIIGEEDDEDEW